MDKRYYIAYGSNLNYEQMRWRCPDAKVIGTSVIPDYRLIFRGARPAATSPSSLRKDAAFR